MAEKSKRGGKRPGAGRPKGARNRLTQEAAKKAAKTGETPLDFLLKVQRNTKNELTVRMDAAKAAAPYVHPRLTAVDHGGSIELTHEEMLDQLDD